MTLTRLAASILVASGLALAGCGAVLAPRADRVEARAEAAFPPEGRIIDVDGTRVHAVVRGTGPDLVLIHGASGNARDFTFDLVGRLQGRYRVIAFDRPGFGYTDRLPFARGASTRAETPSEQAELLSKAAARLGADRPIVLGHSYGGAVAMAWALDHPAAAVVDLSGATMPFPGGVGRLNEIAGSTLGGVTLVPLVAAFPPEGRVEDVIAAIFAPDPVPPGYVDHIGAPLTLRRVSLRANGQQLDQLKAQLRLMAPRYPEIDLPLEIVHGEADDTVDIDLHSAAVARLVPGAHLVRLPGRGHMIQHSAIDAVIAAIDRAARRAGLR